jgi:hypothetical protein
VKHGTEYVNNCYIVTPFLVNGTTGRSDALVYQVCLCSLPAPVLLDLAYY